MNTQSQIDIASMSQDQLAALIASAQQAVVEKQQEKRGEVTAQIEELARSIGAKVTLDFAEAKAKKEVAAKFRNPNNAAETWSGRGLAPKWMQALIATGRNKDEFLIAA